MTSKSELVNLSDQDLSHLSGKYLTFALSNEEYGLSILDVFEIFGMKPITRVPRAPEYIKGVINLRGRIVPIVDLRIKFGMPEAKHNEKTCIIVVNVSINDVPVVVGMIVDTVLEVRDYTSDFISSAPEYGFGLDTKFIIGMGKYSNNNVTILIDINKVFNNSELSSLVTTQNSEVNI
jgi:purine-binding chemotaxis protein CheW